MRGVVLSENSSTALLHTNTHTHTWEQLSAATILYSWLPNNAACLYLRLNALLKDSALFTMTLRAFLSHLRSLNQPRFSHKPNHSARLAA